MPLCRRGGRLTFLCFGVPLELAALRQSRALIRLSLRSSAHSQGWGPNSDSGSIEPASRVQCRYVLIAVAAYIHWASSLKRLKFDVFEALLACFSHESLSTVQALSIKTNDLFVLKLHRVSQKFYACRKRQFIRFQPNPHVVHGGFWCTGYVAATHQMKPQVLQHILR